MAMVFALLTSCVTPQKNDTHAEVIGQPESRIARLSGVFPARESIVNNEPAEAPVLSVFFGHEYFQGELVQTLQWGTNWSVILEDGTGFFYSADSAHPLQLRPVDFNNATLNMNMSDEECRCLTGPPHHSRKLGMQFSDDYPPDFVSVIRWDASLVTGDQDVEGRIEKGENVEVEDGFILITTNGRDYIYSINAQWSNGSSNYTFRVVSGINEAH